MSEKEQLRGFILNVAEQLLADTPTPEAGSFLSSIREPVARADSLAGLRDAARDMVEWCQDLGPVSVARIDQHLRAAGLPTLTAMRDRGYRHVLRILSRGRVASEEEYRLLSAFTSDHGGSELGRDDFARAEELLGAYSRGMRDSRPIAG